MAAISDGNIIELRTVCQLADQLGINVYHYRAHDSSVVAATPVTTAEAAAFLDSTFATNLKGCMTQSASYYGVGVRRILPTISLEDGSILYTGFGLSLFDPLPAQTCGLLAILTGLGGRRQKGRKYIPFPSLDHIAADGKPSGGYKASVLSLGGQYSAPVTINGATGSTVILTPCIKHGDNTTDDVVSVAVRANWGSQRSRGGYGRPNVLPVW